MKAIQTVRIALVAALVAHQVEAESIEVEAFSDERHPVAGIDAAREQGARITLYDLGGPARLTRELNTELPGNLQQAREALIAKIDAIGLEELKQRFRDAYRGRFKAIEYRIERYPAIVFDQGAAVVYGVPDVTDALDRYRNWKASRK